MGGCVLLSFQLLYNFLDQLRKMIEIDFSGCKLLDLRLEFCSSARGSSGERLSFEAVTAFSLDSVTTNSPEGARQPASVERSMTVAVYSSRS
jgi:hypothetical protein